MRDYYDFILTINKIWEFFFSSLFENLFIQSMCFFIIWECVYLTSENLFLTMFPWFNINLALELVLYQFGIKFPLLCSAVPHQPAIFLFQAKMEPEGGFSLSQLEFWSNQTTTKI